MGEEPDETNEAFERIVCAVLEGGTEPTGRRRPPLRIIGVSDHRHAAKRDVTSARGAGWVGQVVEAERASREGK